MSKFLRAQSTTRRRVVGCWKRGFKTVGLLSLIAGVFSPISAMAVVPAQYLAKQYTELLGRVPDAAGFNAAANYFTSAGCSAATLKTWGMGVVQPNGEFTTIAGYTASEQVLLAYRAILNKEPDGTYAQYVSNIKSGGWTIATVAGEMYNSSEFQNLVPYICSPFSYGFGSASGSSFVPSPGPTSIRGITVDQDSLQRSLITNRGKTVSLQPGSLVVLTHPLLIPSGTTLTTLGSYGTTQHALMARVIRGANFPDDLIKICPDIDYVPYYQGGVPPSAITGDTAHCNSGNTIKGLGGSLTSIWVDGQRGVYNSPYQSAISHRDAANNVHVYSGVGIKVTSNFISNNNGGNSIHVDGFHEVGIVCGGASSTTAISYNLITMYPSRHFYYGDAASSGSQSDGITTGCEGGLFQSNSIVDASDAGMAIFRACPVVQHSQVYGANVFSAGNSATTAIGLAPFLPIPASSDTCVPGNYNGSATYPGFGNTLIKYNHVWSGPNTHFIIGIAVGDKAWFEPNATSTDHHSYTGDGATTLSVSNNDTNGASASTGTNILVWGMQNTIIQGNTGTPNRQNSYYYVNTYCPTSNYLVTVVSGMQGSFQTYGAVPPPAPPTGGQCMLEINPGPSPAQTWPGYVYGY